MASLLLLLALPLLAVGDYTVRSLFATSDCTLSATASPSQQAVLYTAGACSSSADTSCTRIGSSGSSYYTQKCIKSDLTLPDTSSMAGVAEYTFPSCTDGMSSSAIPALSTATSLTTLYSPTCTPGGNGMVGYYLFLCGPWGLAQQLFTDSACTNLTETIALSDSFSQCNRNSYGSSGATARVCLTPAPLPAALTPQTCRGSAVPAPLPTAPLRCYAGSVTSTGLSSAYIGGDLNTMCMSVTYSCSKMPYIGGLCSSNTSFVRAFGGLSNFYGGSLVSILASLKQNYYQAVTDVNFCTTDKCNAPASDTCPISSPPYTPLACSVAAPPSPLTASAPIACYSNIPDGGAPQLQATPVPSALNCAAFTVNCLALNKTWWSFPTAYSSKLLKACGTNSVIRAYSDNATLAQIVDTRFYAKLYTDLYPPSNSDRTVFSDVVLCTGPGCNSPASDACALSTSPVVASVVLSGMPASAQDSNGKLTDSGLRVVQASITAAVQSSACATCSATVTQVLDTSTNTVVYSASRRLAFGALSVTFSVTGASASTLALVSAAATSPAFLAATTTALVANGGSAYSSVTSTAAPSSAPASGPPAAPLALLALLALLVVGPALWCWHVRASKAKATAAVAASPQAAAKPEPALQA